MDYQMFSEHLHEYGQIIMLLISGVLLYLAIWHKFEPLLLLPIGFGALLVNLPGVELLKVPVFLDGQLQEAGGLLYYISLGIKTGVLPCLIFLGVGAMTDFGPLLANPKTFLLGAAAQFGIFVTLIGALGLGFSLKEASAIGIIGGADGPTAIFTANKLADHLLGPIAVAAYSYMALVPLIQPPIMRLLTTRKERLVRMELVAPVSKTARVIFPIVTTLATLLFIPTAAPLIGMLMFGNLLRECGVADRLSKAAQNEIMNISTLFVGLAVGAKMEASLFLQWRTIKIILLGMAAFAIGTATGVLLGKVMYVLSRGKVNPLIGAAGVSAVPMAARVVQKVGQEEDPGNFLLMNAMGPNVAGVIGSAIAAGILISLVG